MLEDFFKLNGPASQVNTQAEFEDLLKKSRHVCNVMYVSEEFELKTVVNTAFENVSFSKTTLRKLTFKNCKFIDCLFIGAVFESVNFHDCGFENCNFFRAQFKNVYGKPYQWRRAITRSRYSNVALHLYQQLRENYHQESQREFKNEAEYQFYRWRRKYEFEKALQLLVDSTATKRAKVGAIVNTLFYHTGSWLYDIGLGYGYRLRHFLLTTTVVVLATMFCNGKYSHLFFEEPITKSLIQTVYFTITTMATLGASGYAPDTEIGYCFVVGNVLIGITILSMAVSAIFKKLVP